MISNKKTILAGAGLAGALAVAAAVYMSQQEEAAPVAVRTPEECIQEFGSRASAAGQNIKLEPGQSVMALTENTELQAVAQGLTECIETYANSQEKSGFHIGRPAPVSP